MSDFVSEYSSIFYYLKDTVLINFIEKELDVPLVYDQETGHYLAQSVMEPDPVGKYRGWVYFDELDGKPIRTAEQSNRVIIYRQGGVPIPSSQYNINYLLGGVTYSGPPGNSNIPKTADYYWNYVAVQDHWPGEDMVQIPIVALDMIDTTKMGYQLGHGRKSFRVTNIDIFASSAQELRELTETIYNGFYLKSILALDFSDNSWGHPLNYDGTFNDRFTNIEAHPDYNGCLMCDRTKATRVGLPVSLNDFNRFRSRVVVDILFYDEKP